MSTQVNYNNSPNTDLFDVGNLRCESLRNLGDHFLNEWLVFHCLSSFHDSKKRSCKLTQKIKQCVVYSPHYRCLNDIFPVFINSLQYIS